MKTLVSLAASLLVAAFLLAVLPLDGEERIYSDTLRLHVLAASDSETDQARKLLVRDAILGSVSEALDGVTDPALARERIAASTEAIAAEATAALRAEGDAHDVSVTLTRELYPRRVYGTYTLPAGEYTSLRVVIGEGSGHNWWCILFPSLCLPAAAAEEPAEQFRADGFTRSAYETVSGDGPRIRVKWKILEWIGAFLSG